MNTCGATAGERVIIITGSGRSGTSAVAQALHISGVPVGHDLIEADEGNPEGYFEERGVVRVNDAILNAAGNRAWFNEMTRAQVIAASEEYAPLMRELLHGATPAWKDPRFSWTLEAWMRLMPERPRVIVCLRSPDEVIASTLRYYGLAGEEPEGAVAHEWRCEYERLLEIIDEYALDAVPVEFAELHNDPELAIEPVARFVGRSLDASGVRRALRHHRAAVRDDLRDVYERVRALGAAWRGYAPASG